MNVLLIEPADAIRDFFQTALEQDGFRVLAVRDNREALDAAEALPIDLVVAQFLDEADTAGRVDLLASLSARSPGFKVLAVLSGFRTGATTAIAPRRMLNPWRTVDLTQGGHVLLDACRDAERERQQSPPPAAFHEQLL
jgi:DNA-binding NtrC family response regulator